MHGPSTETLVWAHAKIVSNLSLAKYFAIVETQGEKQYVGHKLTFYLLPFSYQCSVTCGVGVQSREIYCRVKSAGRVREDLCDAHQRPATYQPCQTAECNHYTWVTGEWEEVSNSLILSLLFCLHPPSRFPCSASQCEGDEQMFQHLIKVFIG